MAQPFVGEIMLFAGNFEISGWKFCNGQLLTVADYGPLFSLVGTTYGGNGVTTFALPDLRSRVPLHFGQGPGQPSYAIGQSGGVEQVTLTAAQNGPHSHTVGVRNEAGNSSSPTGKVWANAPGNIYQAGSGVSPMSSAAVSSAGGSQPHENVQPILCLHFIIAVLGIFPTQIFAGGGDAVRSK